MFANHFCPISPARFPVHIVRVLVVLFVPLSTQAAGATFTPLGYLANGYFYSEANDVSADGRVVVGQAHNGTLGNEAFRWTAATGMQGLGDFPTGDFYSVAMAVSADGNAIVGRATAGQAALIDAFRWTPATGLLPLGHLPTDSFAFSYGLGVSGDGSIAVGGSRSLSGNEAFQWSDANGMIGLGDLPGGPFESYANDISSDGKTIVGESKSADALEPFRWTKETGMIGLGFLPGLVSENHAWAVSADGNTIVGDIGGHGWRWTAATGMVELPNLAGGWGVFPSDVSADGATIVGATSPNGPFQKLPAFIWTSQRGTQNLQQYLEQTFGLVLNGWLLTNANGISDDGKVIVGTGMNPYGRPEAWVIDLSTPEPNSTSLCVILATIWFVMHRPSRKGNTYFYPQHSR